MAKHTNRWNIKQLATGRDENGAENFHIFCGKGNRGNTETEMKYCETGAMADFFYTETETEWHFPAE